MVTFTAPAGGGDFIDCREMVGDLVLFVAIRSSRTRWDDLREEDATILTIDFVNLSKEGELLTGVQCSDKYVVNKLSVGQTYVLGRIQQLEPKKAGWKGAIILAPYEEADIAVAQKWVEANKPKAFAGPAEEAKPATAKTTKAAKPATQAEELDRLLG